MPTRSASTCISAYSYLPSSYDCSSRNNKRTIWKMKMITMCVHVLLSVCMYLCARVCSSYVYTCMCIPICLFTHTHSVCDYDRKTDRQTDVCVWVCVCVCVYLCVSVFLSVCLYTYVSGSMEIPHWQPP